MPAVILVTFVIIVSAITIVSTCRAHHKQEHHRDRCGSDVCAKQKRKLWLFLSLLIMVVVGWALALVATEEIHSAVTHAAAAGYILFSAGQGFYLFLFVGVFNPGIRREWMKIICCVPMDCRSSNRGCSCDA